jgi:hypothetical protein
MFSAGVGLNFILFTPTVIDGGFEYLNSFAAVFSSRDFFQKKFGFTGEHGARDTF